jgi:hypothetical protein
MEIFFFLDKLFGLFVNYLVRFVDLLINRNCLNKFDLVDKILTITDLDPIRRYLPPSDRPKPNSRYSSIQVNLNVQYFIKMFFFKILIRIHYVINILQISQNYEQLLSMIQLTQKRKRLQLFHPM